MFDSYPVSAQLPRSARRRRPPLLWQYREPFWTLRPKPQNYTPAKISYTGTLSLSQTAIMCSSACSAWIRKPPGHGDFRNSSPDPAAAHLEGRWHTCSRVRSHNFRHARRPLPRPARGLPISLPLSPFPTFAVGLEAQILEVSSVSVVTACAGAAVTRNATASAATAAAAALCAVVPCSTQGVQGWALLLAAYTAAAAAVAPRVSLPPLQPGPRPPLGQRVFRAPSLAHLLRPGSGLSYHHCAARGPAQQSRAGSSLLEGE